MNKGFLLTWYTTVKFCHIINLFKKMQIRFLILLQTIFNPYSKLQTNVSKSSLN